MTGWIEENISGPIAAALVTGVAVPLVLAMYRRRRTIGEVRDSLSSSEAKFRADLILRMNTLTERCDRLQRDNLECERRNNELQAEMTALRIDLRSLKTGD